MKTQIGTNLFTLITMLFIILSCKKEEEQTIPQEVINPCDSISSFEYGGQIYNTVEIGSQCWMKENLNIGVMIWGTLNQSDNGLIEKYCYNNEPDSCSKYGGIYQWREVMQYTIQEGSQGICPPGWHLPSDEEWKVLEGFVDSEYEVGDGEWDNYGDRGTDAGLHLKAITGWNDNGNGTDLFGFSGLSGGFSEYNGFFRCVGTTASWWSSTGSSDGYSWIHYVDIFSSGVGRYNSWIIWGNGVRCIKD